jgi:hypothetical protein
MNVFLKGLKTFFYQQFPNRDQEPWLFKLHKNTVFASNTVASNNQTELTPPLTFFRDVVVASLGPMAPVVDTDVV